MLNSPRVTPSRRQVEGDVAIVRAGRPGRARGAPGGEQRLTFVFQATSWGIWSHSMAILGTD